jgi:hypothetical protein
MPAKGSFALAVLVLGVLVFGVLAYAQAAEPAFAFSFDIGSETELSDPFMDGGGNVDLFDLAALLGNYGCR